MNRRWFRGLAPVCVLACCPVVTLAAAVGDEAAGTPAHGELAATVRSAGQPCAHVTGVEAITENRWAVQCNAGSHVVVRTEDGGLALARP